MSESIANGISITNTCYECQVIAIQGALDSTSECYECKILAADQAKGYPVGACQTCADRAMLEASGYEAGKCATCLKNDESNADDNAWNLHEDDRLGEGPALYLDMSDAPSASDWVASETTGKESKYIIRLETIKIKSGTYIDAEGQTRDYNDDWYHIEERVVVTKREEDFIIRNEFLPPIAQLVDGGVYEELWELQDQRQRAREVQCHWCNILTPKIYNDCQTCDKPLESNVR